MSLPPHHPLQFLSHGDAASHDHHVDIVRWPFEEDIPHVAPHHIALQPQTVCGLTDLMEYLLI